TFAPEAKRESRFLGLNLIRCFNVNRVLNSHLHSFLLRNLDTNRHIPLLCLATVPSCFVTGLISPAATLVVPFVDLARTVGAPNSPAAATIDTAMSSASSATS